MNKSTNLKEKAPLLVSLIVALCFCFWAGCFIWKRSVVALDGVRYFHLADDAMISMRYANNLAKGFGLVYNPGERVEGVTNLLWTVYMAPWNALLPNALASIPIMVTGLILSLGTALMTARMAFRLCSPMNSVMTRWLGPLVFAAALSLYPLNYWSLCGMETIFISFLGLVVFDLVFFRSDTRFNLALPVLYGLLYLTRPDTLILVLVVMAYRYVVSFRLNRAKGPFLGECLIFGSILAGVTAFRYSYYGDIVPNTYRLKVEGLPLLWKLKKGIPYILHLVFVFYVPLIMMTLALLKKIDLRRWTLGVTVILFCGYTVSVGGDWAVGFRVVGLVLPLILALAAVGLVDVVGQVRILGGGDFEKWNRDSLERSCKFALFGLLLFAGVISADYPFRKEILTCGGHEIGFTDHINTAVVLKAIAKDEASVAVIWAGTVPYFTSFRTIDLLGKCDKYVAASTPHLNLPGMFSVAGHNKHCPGYSICQLKPSYLEVYQPEDWWDRDVMDYFRKNYEKVQFEDVTLWLRSDEKGVTWRSPSGLAKPLLPGSAWSVHGERR